jgi:hypothetical protein
MATQTALVLLLSVLGVSSEVAQAQSVEPVTGGSFTLSERWSHYLHRTLEPTRLGVLAAETAVDHGFGEPGCWDASAGSYLQRYARAFDRRLIRNTTEFVTGIMTGEDLRYRKSWSHSIGGRVWNALRGSMEAQMPDGRTRLGYTRFFASATAELTTAHWTGQPIQTRWIFQSLGWSALDQVETNLLNEFGPDIRRVAGRLRDAALTRTGHHRQP